MGIKEFKKIIKSISSFPGVEGAMILTREGLSLISTIDKADDSDLSTMSAALTGAAQTITKTLDYKNLEYILLKNRQSKQLFYLIDNLIVIILASQSVKTSLILNKLKEFSKEIVSLVK